METKDVNDAFKQFDDTTSTTLPIRSSLIKKLHDIVKDYDMNLDSCSPSDRESFMAVINGLGGLLNDQEKSAIANVKLHLQQKSDESSSETSNMVIDLLKSMAGRSKSISLDTTPTVVTDSKQHELEEACDTAEIEILEGELEEIPSIVGESND